MFGKFHFWSRLRALVFLHLANLPLAGHGQRPFFIKLAGVKMADSSHTFIGEGCVFDTTHPELISIEAGVCITMKCIILTHYIDPQTHRYSSGPVTIKERAFLGANTIITKSVTIGKRAVVGAGSVVTKDIPDYEVWAGNPARFIKKIDH